MGELKDNRESEITLKDVAMDQVWSNYTTGSKFWKEETLDLGKTTKENVFHKGCLFNV